MYSAYTNLVKSAKEIFCDINRTLKFRGPDIRRHIAECRAKSRSNIEEKQHEFSWKRVVGLLLLRISAELRTNDLSDRHQRLGLQEEEDLLAASHPYNVS